MQAKNKNFTVDKMRSFEEKSLKNGKIEQNCAYNLLWDKLNVSTIMHWVVEFLDGVYKISDNFAA